MATKSEITDIKLTQQELTLMKEANEKEHTAIIVELKALSKKLDDAMFCKADKSDVDSLKNKLWGVTAGVLMAFVGLLVYLIETQMRG